MPTLTPKPADAPQIAPAQMPPPRRAHPFSLGVMVALGLALGLVATVAHEMATVWQSDPSVSQGPLIVALTAGLLWMRRAELRAWRSASAGGLLLLCLSALAYLAGMWADIDFLKPAALVGMAAGAVWFLGGAPAIEAAAGPLGLLFFAIPWPTTITERFAFPLQMASTGWAHMFAGMLGLNILRDGVNLTVLGESGRPIYAIVVAQACSGLTSLNVLLALAYLVAYFTPVRFYWRLAMVAAMLPLALFLNAVRLTFVLLAGAKISPAVGNFVHDHEQPVLLLLGSFALLGIRQALLSRLSVSGLAAGDANEKDETQEANAPEAAPAASVFAKPHPARLPLTVAILTTALLGSLWESHMESLTPIHPEFLRRLPLSYHGWATKDEPLESGDLKMLQPDDILVRRYNSQPDFKGSEAELAVVAGHQKRTIHTPSYCLTGGGWETLWQRQIALDIAGRRIPAAQSLVATETPQGRLYEIVTYFFTNGTLSTAALVPFQQAQLWERLRGHVPLGALVRVRVPLTTNERDAVQLSDDFARTMLPPVLNGIRQAQRSAPPERNAPPAGRA